jgi:hypothetical protein
MSGTPPAPDFTRSRVIPGATYIQLSPFEKVELREQYNADVTAGSFWQRAPHDGAYFKVAGLGRSVMPDLAVAERESSQGVQYPQGLTADVQKGLWTAQVLAFWLTDGVAYRHYKGMEGLVSANGHDPGDASVVLDVNGYARTDLRSLLNPKGSAQDAEYVKGPDSIFGPELESVLEEYAGTGKLFGKSIPAQSKPVLDRLLTQVVTPRLTAARTKATSGAPPAPKSAIPPTPCSKLTPEARRARKDCASGLSEIRTHLAKTRGRAAFAEAPSGADAKKGTVAKGSKDNTLLYVGAAGLTLVLGASAFFLYKRSQK